VKACAACVATAGRPAVRPGRDVDKIRIRYDAALDFYSPEEVYVLARAMPSEQDAELMWH
jgi:hypothetical protein